MNTLSILRSVLSGVATTRLLTKDTGQNAGCSHKRTKNRQFLLCVIVPILIIFQALLLQATQIKDYEKHS